MTVKKAVKKATSVFNRTYYAGKDWDSLWVIGKHTSIEDMAKSGRFQDLVNDEFGGIDESGEDVFVLHTGEGGLDPQAMVYTAKPAGFTMVARKTK